VQNVINEKCQPANCSGVDVNWRKLCFIMCITFLYEYKQWCIPSCGNCTSG